MKVFESEIKFLSSDVEPSILTKFYESLTPLYVICRLVGALPIKAIRDGREVIMAVHREDRSYFFSYVGVYFVLSLYAIYSIIADKGNYKMVPQLLVLTESSVILILMFVTLFFCFYFRKVLLDCMILLSEVDATFMTLGIAINYVLARKTNFKVFGIMLMSVFLRTVVMLCTLRVDIIQQFTLFVATFIKSLSKYEFLALLLPISVRFKQVNDTIISYHNRQDDVKLNDNLYTLCRLHFKLCNISRLLNGGFAFQLLASLGVSLTDILFQSFYLYTTLTKKFHIASTAQIASPIIWLADEFLEIYLMVHACSTTCEIANSTSILLHELRNTIRMTEVDIHIQMYSLQLLHQKLEFSALGFFSIDYSLLYSLIGAVTTYLVIFIQFDQSQDSRNNMMTTDTTESFSMTMTMY